MRYPKYLSPSALSVWQYNQEQYYLRYLAETPPPREPQTQAMSIGSAFDAYVKSYMFENLFGKGKDPAFALEAIFEQQVEEHNREWAWEHGRSVFDFYKSSGALADLLLELEKSSQTPRFEFTVEGSPFGVPLLGKPDVWYINSHGHPIILDFKVNGYCSNYTTSPKRGYIKLRPQGTEHKLCQLMTVCGVKVNIAEFFENIAPDWAQQLATYAWLCGAEVGSNFIVAVDQIVGSPSLGLRVAEHRSQIGAEYQQSVASAYTDLWSIIHSGHIFRDRSVEESAKRCDVLDIQHVAFQDGDSFLKEILNGPRY